MGLRGALLIMAISCVPAFATSPPPAPTPEPEKCVDNPIIASHAEAESRAVAEVERKWQKLVPGQFKVETSRTGCDWLVMVRLLPIREGGHFGVFLRAANGKVEWSVKIDA